MLRWKKRLVVFVAISALLFTSTGFQALAQDLGSLKKAPAAEAMLADLALARPAGVVATVFGTALFVFSLPFTAIGGSVSNAAKKLIAAPVQFTFVRELGDMKDQTWRRD